MSRDQLLHEEPEKDRAMGVPHHIIDRPCNLLTGCILLMSLLIISAQVPSGSGQIPGSCVAAGHTGCCNDGCRGDTGLCLCDPSCEAFGDCCDDIDEVCNPEAAPLNHLIPTVWYTDTITYHTLQLHWIVTHHDSQINGTFRVSVHKRNGGMSFNTSLVNTSQYSVPVVSTGSVQLGTSYVVILEDLEEGTEYNYAISIVSDVGTLEDAVTGSFTTKKYPSIDNVTVMLTESFGVHVSWLAPSVPEGVAISHFKVYYHATGQASVLSHDWVPPGKTSLTLGDLDTHLRYRFEVAVVIVEADGRSYEILEARNGQEIYLPGSILFQLVARSSFICEEWNLQEENEVVSLLHSEVMEMLRHNCSCSYPEQNLHNENLVAVCTDNSFIEVTYRAKLLTVAGYSETELLDAIEVWRHSSPFSQAEGDGLLLSMSENCPTRLEYATQPLCRTVTNRECAEAVAECPVSVSALVAYLIGELALLTALAVIGILAAVCVAKARRKRCRRGEVCAAENQYSSPSSSLSRALTSAGREGRSNSPEHSPVKWEST